MAKMLQEASLLSPLFARDRLEPTTPATRQLRCKNHNENVQMSKPKPKMLQEASPSLLSPLFERGSLEPATSRVLKLGSALNETRFLLETLLVK
ncbi:hypothetical protein L596_000493 [Steinernema carpocapsae]|uniref:Uncharacterized protein n=1 Tax=Steinernema carpocapsae TaxID=34508 RepID=A0A4U8UKP6_STECR|nr:hypothetical protein L596_000493 [Steinernema carpocapsae]